MPIDPIHMGQGLPSSAEVSRVQRLHHQEGDSKFGQMASAFQAQIKRASQRVKSANPAEHAVVNKDRERGTEEHSAGEEPKRKKAFRRVKHPGMGKYIDEVR